MKILSLIKTYEQQQKKTFNLVASENIMSSNARYALQSDLTHRYIIPPENERPKEIWEYPNQKYPRLIEKMTKEYAKKIYSGKYADVRPLSGNNAVYIVLKSLVPKGGTIFRIPSNCGGHFATLTICKWDDYHFIDIPYNIQEGNIDILKLKKLYKKYKPQLLLLDASMILFPHPVKEIREALGSNIIISYDASQVFGIIGGKKFQAPLKEGADLIHGSVHKSLFGPQKAMIICKEDGKIAKKIHDAITPLFVSNSHPHHVAALGIALEEFLTFGETYAEQTMTNAKALARYLYSRGFNIQDKKRDFTESHQLFCSIGSKKRAFRAFLQLEEIGIHTNFIKIPFADNYGLRIGTAEITRRGLKKSDVIEIGKLIVKCLSNRADKKILQEKVANLSAEFTGLHYSC
jgi:glycine hydroxymethyltransferase